VEVDHGAIEELLGAYALNAVDPHDAVMVDSHVAGCFECRAELEQHLEVAALLPASSDFAPASVWDAIAGELGRERSPERSSVQSLNPRRHWRMRRLAAAAAFVLLAGAAVVQSARLGAVNDDLAAVRSTVVALEQQIDRPILEIAASQARLNPLAQQVMLGSEVSGSNAIIVLMPDGTGYLVEHTLKPLPPDRTYQLWSIVDGKVISAGVLGPEPGVVPFHIDPAGFEGFAITEEVIGGVPSSDNAPVVVWLAA